MVGTVCYMPPEQIRGERSIDHRADIYALGAMLYECLTGSLPHPAGELQVIEGPADQPGAETGKQVAVQVNVEVRGDAQSEVKQVPVVHRVSNRSSSACLTSGVGSTW